MCYIVGSPAAPYFFLLMLPYTPVSSHLSPMPK